MPLPIRRPLSASEAKRQAIERVRAHADPNWMVRARRAVMQVALAKGVFTSDDVWAVLGDDRPPEPRALGAVLTQLAHDLKIEPTSDYRDSDRPECHGRPVRVWRRRWV